MNNYILYLSGARNQQFYIKPQVSGLYLNNLNLNSNKQILAPNLVYNTGNQTISGIKTFLNNLIISGNLNVTGNILLSGNQVLTGSSTLYATSANLELTGSTLNTKIDNLSGYINSSSSNIVFTTGNQNIAGNKTFINNINVSGTGVFNAVDLNNIDDLSISGVNVSIIDGAISLTNRPTVNGTGVVLSGELTASGNLLQGQINTLTTNLFTTGSNLNNKINSLSGNAVLTFGNQSIDGAKTFNSGIIFNASNGGSPTNFYNARAINFQALGGTNSAAIYGSYNGYPKIAIALSQAIIPNLSSPLQDLIEIKGGQTVSSSLMASNIPITISGNQVLTGVNLSSYATVANLFSTGSNLDNKINNLSGFINNNVVFTTGNQTINGNLNISGNLQITGHFSAASKSFLINHPTTIGKKLQYGSLEGPEHGVFVRGKTNENIINLPNYWSALVDENSISVNLTPINIYSNIYVVNYNNTRIITNGNNGNYYFYTVYGERKDIPKLTVEF